MAKYYPVIATFLNGNVMVKFFIDRRWNVLSNFFYGSNETN